MVHKRNHISSLIFLAWSSLQPDQQAIRDGHRTLSAWLPASHSGLDACYRGRHRPERRSSADRGRAVAVAGPAAGPMQPHRTVPDAELRLVPSANFRAVRAAGYRREQRPFGLLEGRAAIGEDLLSMRG